MINTKVIDASKRGYYVDDKGNVIGKKKEQLVLLSTKVYIRRDNGLVVCAPWTGEVVGSNPTPAIGSSEDILTDDPPIAPIQFTFSLLPYFR